MQPNENGHTKSCSLCLLSFTAIQLTETATAYVSNKTDGRLTVLEYLVLVSGTGSYNDLNVTTKFKILLLIKLQYKSAEQNQSFAAFLRK